MESKAMEKTAIDQAASSYWSDYFKEYGKMWVRNIPRRIKTATARHLKAKIEGEFAPIAGNINPVDDGLTVEASFVGKINDKEAKILVTASFDQEGKLSEFICNRVS